MALGNNNENFITNQIDYILIDKRYINGIKCSRAYPGADIGSDHNPVVAKIEIRMKKVQKRIRTRTNFKKLKEPETKEKVVPVLNNKFQDSLQLETTESLWQSFKNVI